MADDAVHTPTPRSPPHGHGDAVDAGADAGALADARAGGKGGDDAVLALLKRRFGHETFRPMQRQIVDHAVAGRDLLVIMPTGGGKSLCYQLPALIRHGTTVVISPLIALMQDQLQALRANGVAATVLNSSVAGGEILERERAALRGEYELIYMAPERLMSGAGQRLLARLEVALFAIDEAHCISEWGHDFRPEYRMLGQLRQSFGGRFTDVPIMALTATATPRVADDIVAQLKLRDATRYRAGFERTNLYYEIRPKQNTFKQILAYLQDHPAHEGIIYCHSRASTESLAQRLVDKGVAALPYHAGLNHDTRARNQHEFVYGDTRVMTATIAFGMGIDKPDVRFVMHADLPRHLEGYYQETGRAGRDGLAADCILFFSAADRAKIEYFIEQKASEHERELAHRQLGNVLDFAYCTGCRCVPLLGYFGEKHAGQCGHCDNCKHPPVMQDITVDAQKLLSAVARTGQRFGLGHVIDVLCGAASERMQRYGHAALSVFNIGADKPRPYWRRVAETLIAGGHLGVTTEQYPTLHLTEQSVPALRGELPLQMARPRALSSDDGAPRRRRDRSRDGARSRVSFEPADDMPVDASLFEKLRQLRRKLAQDQAVPPYVVFGDVSLRHMASVKPTTNDQFARITGVGEHKLARYGPAFIETIREHTKRSSASSAEGHE